MTLPFADKPELSRVYADLKTKTVSQITATEIDALKASIFTEGVNGVEDELRRLFLVQLLSIGVPITTSSTLDVDVKAGAPLDDAQNVNVSDTTGSGNPNGIVFRPADGEVWILNGASVPAVFNASSIELKLSDDAGIDIRIAEVSGGDQTFPVNASSTGVVYLTHDVYLKYFITGATGNCFIRSSVIRIR